MTQKNIKKKTASNVFVYLFIFAFVLMLSVFSAHAIQTIVVIDSRDVNGSVEVYNHGVGQEIDLQMQGVASGGNVLTVRTLAQNQQELRVNNIVVQTDLNVTARTDSSGVTRLQARLDSGQEREIMVMPNVASETALNALATSACSSENNCTIELRSVGSGNAERVQYEMQLEKDRRLFGLFPIRMRVRADVDAQTGEALVRRPWWSFMATSVNN